MVFASNGNKTLKDNIANIYGINSIDSLMPLNFSFKMTTRTILRKLDPSADDTSDVQIEGYISKPIFGQGRSSGDRQLCYINSRPCVLPQVSRAVTDVYKTFNTTQIPFFVLNLKLDTTRYDVNVSPDKRTILLHGESMLIELIREHLTVEFEEAGHSIPKNVANNKGLSAGSAGRTQGRLFSSMISKFSNGPQKVPEEEEEVQQSVEEEEVVPEEEQDGEQEDEDLDEEQDDQERDDEPLNEEQDEEGSQVEEVSEADLEADLSEDIREKPAPRKNLRQETTMVAPEDEDEDEDEDEEIDSDLFVTENSPIPSARSNRRTATTLVDLDSLPLRGKLNFDEPFKVTVASQGKSEYISLKSTPTSSGRSKARSKANSVQNEPKSMAGFGELLKYVKPNEVGEEEEIDADLDDKSMADEMPMDTETGIEQAEPSEDEKPTPRRLQMTQRSQVVYRSRTHNLDFPVSVSLKKIEKGAKQLAKTKSAMESSTKTHNTNSKESKSLSDITVSDIAGTEELVEGMLNLTIHKEDFLKMELVGQFNLGFILVTKVNGRTGHKDLFIVDQHASDEIYNFERLQSETVIQKQPLVV